jgi:hypothetical protein
MPTDINNRTPTTIIGILENRGEVRVMAVSAIPELKEELRKDEIQRLQLLFRQRVVLVITGPWVVLEKL